MRIEAEEARLLVRCLLAGTGNMKNTDFTSFMNELNAKTGVRPSRVSPRSAKEMEVMIAGLGVRGFKTKFED